MNRDQHPDVSDAINGMLRFVCGHCGALPLDWCTKPSGKRTSFLHASRFWQWKERDVTPPPSWPLS